MNSAQFSWPRRWPCSCRRRSPPRLKAPTQVRRSPKTSRSARANSINWSRPSRSIQSPRRPSADGRDLSPGNRSGRALGKGEQSLTGDKLEKALAKQDWDASVKSLVATPTVLTTMNEELDWTEKLGDAVLAQQADVMDAIQRLRGKPRPTASSRRRSSRTSRSAGSRQTGHRHRADLN